MNLFKPCFVGIHRSMEKSYVLCVGLSTHKYVWGKHWVFTQTLQLSKSRAIQGRKAHLCKHPVLLVVGRWFSTA